MFEDLSGKFGKLKMPEGPLIRKIERVKKTTEAPTGRCSPTLLPDVVEQLRRTTEVVTKKIEETINLKTEQIKANTEAIKNIEAQIIKTNQIVSSGKESTDEFKRRLDKIDETILELTSLYEVVSNTVNSFVGDNPNQLKEKLANIEKRIEELNQKTPKLPPNLTRDFDNKFKTLENSMEELKKIVESNAVNQEAIVEKITGNVIERIKPELRTESSGMPTIPPSQTSIAQQKARTSQNIDDTQNIKLISLDNKPETSIILLNWIEFLMEKVGRNNLVDVLDYYVEIGWISEEVSSKMIGYANGIDYYVERPTWKLLPEDHTKSLLFIEQLRGRKIDKNSLSKLERDVDKIIRSSEVLVL